jgi:acetylornithine/succinyldiaminopimelate/putrescine aminotransferase
MLEAVQGEGGVIPADEAFIQGVRELCNEKNLLMLCDEVQCGMGRTGHWFAVQGYGVDPDAFSLAKSLGNGCPIGAVVSGPKLADVFQPGRHASTFGGNPLACAAALATLEVIEEEGLVERAQRTGELFIEGLKMFAESFPDQVETARGRGLMLGMVLRQPAKPFVDTLADMGLLSLATAENVVRFLPPLNVKDNELEEALDIISDGLTGCPADEPVEEPAPAAETAEAPAEEEPAVGAAPAEPEATPGEGAQS